MSTRPNAEQPYGFLEATKSIVALLCVGLFVLTFTMQPFRIPSESMESTLLVGDLFLADKNLGDPSSPFLPPADLHRRDIVVFHDPVAVGRYLVKRIVALPGDRLHLRSGSLFVNGQMVQEPYALHDGTWTDAFRDNFPNASPHDPDVLAPWRISLPHLVDRGDLVVPPDSFFVMGDNRDNSLDSRFWGFVPRALIVGRPLVVYLSLRRLPVSAGQSHTRTTLSPRFVRWNRTLTLIH